MVLPVSLDFEIYIVDKLARYIIRDVEEHEAKINSLEEHVWADDLYERLVAAGDKEIDANKEYWANRQQAALAEDQQEFARLIKERKKGKK
jgi:predicted DNA-binding protein